MLDQAKHVEREEVHSPKGNKLDANQSQVQNQSQLQDQNQDLEQAMSLTNPSLKLLENLINDIMNDYDLLILTDDLQEDTALMATIGVLPLKFVMQGEQPLQLVRDVLTKEEK